METIELQPDNNLSKIRMNKAEQGNPITIPSPSEKV